MNALRSASVIAALMVALVGGGATPAQARFVCTSDCYAWAQMTLPQSYRIYAGPVDGKNGPLTRSGVRVLQRRYGLKVDGIIGPKTFDCLEWCRRGAR